MHQGIKLNKSNWIENDEITYRKCSLELIEINRIIIKSNKKFEIRNVQTRWHKNNNLEYGIDICFTVNLLYKKNLDDIEDFDIIEYTNFDVQSIEMKNKEFFVYGNIIKY